MVLCFLLPSIVVHYARDCLCSYGSLQRFGSMFWQVFRWVSVVRSEWIKQATVRIRFVWEARGGTCGSGCLWGDHLPAFGRFAAVLYTWCVMCLLLCIYCFLGLSEERESEGEKVWRGLDEVRSYISECSLSHISVFSLVS